MSSPNVHGDGSCRRPVQHCDLPFSLRHEHLAVSRDRGRVSTIESRLQSTLTHLGAFRD